MPVFNSTMKRLFTTAVLTAPLLAGCDPEGAQHVGVGTPVSQEKDYTTEQLKGPPAPYGASNVPVYSVVKFDEKKLGLKEKLICISTQLPTSASLTCPGMQTIPLETIKQIIRETVKEELKP